MNINNVVRPPFGFLYKTKVPNLAIVASRGCGKTYAAARFAVDFLLAGRQNGTVTFASETVGGARDSVRDAMLDVMPQFPINVCYYKSQEHKFIFKIGHNDIREFRLKGYDGAKRGLHDDLIILDECASMPAGMLEAVFIPMSVPVPEKDLPPGRIIAIGTARGKNTFYDLWMRGKSKSFPEWESYTIKAADSPIYSEEFLRERKRNMTPALYSQEYECDFESNLLYGAVYADDISKFTINNIDDSFIWDPASPVFTAWDIGVDDYTSIWFFQVKNNTVTFIDFYEDNGQGAPYYAEVLLKKPYKYRECILPCTDGFRRDFRGAPIPDQLMPFGLRCAPTTYTTEIFGINKARDLLKVCRFNKSNCAQGIEHLKMFKFRVNNNTGLKTNVTVPDQHAHAADAFRYVAVSPEIWGKFSGNFVKDDNFFSEDSSFIGLGGYSVWD
jgi:hypothetical protein